MKSPVSGNGNIFRSSVTVTLKWLSMQNTQSDAVKKTLRNMIAAAMVRLYTIAVTDKSLEFLDALLKIFHDLHIQYYQLHHRGPSSSTHLSKLEHP